MLLDNLSLWNDTTFCIHCSPVAGLSGWMYILFGISGSALPATIHLLEIFEIHLKLFKLDFCAQSKVNRRADLYRTHPKLDCVLIIIWPRESGFINFSFYPDWLACLAHLINHWQTLFMSRLGTPNNGRCQVESWSRPNPYHIHQLIKNYGLTFGLWWSTQKSGEEKHVSSYFQFFSPNQTWKIGIRINKIHLRMSFLSSGWPVDHKTG